MNINYNNLDSFSDSDPFADDLTISSEISSDLASDISSQETTSSVEKDLSEDTPYTSSVHLVSEHILTTYESQDPLSDSQKLTANYLPIIKNEIANIKKPIVQERTKETNQTPSRVEEDPFNSHYIAFLGNLPELLGQRDLPQKSNSRLVKVQVLNLAKPEQYKAKVLEAAKKAFDAGEGILIPKDESQPIQAQENIAKFLEKHNITEIEAIMPSGETKKFKNVKFQVITGATSSALSRSFNELANVIALAREREEREKQKQIETQSQTSSSVIADLIKEKNLGRKPPREITTFQLCFCTVGESKYKKTSTIELGARAAEEKKENEEIERESNKKHQIRKEEISKQTEKGRQREEIIKAKEIDKQSQNQSVQKTETSKKIKEKVKVSADPDALPIDLVDNTREKRPT